MKSSRTLGRAAAALLLLSASAAVLPAAERGAAAENVARKNETAPRDADSQSASHLLGMTVKTAQNERVGKVEDFFVDLTSGRIVGVILSSGGFLGIGDVLSIVQPSSLSRAPDGELRLDLSKEKLAAAPRYERRDLGERIKDRWSEASDEMRRRRDRDLGAASSSSSSGVSIREPDRPRSVTDADNTARNRRDHDPSMSVDPLDQSNRRSDIETTAKIRSAIVGDNRLSTNAKNVKIVTRDGQVTLRGPVASEEERRIVNEIAAQAAPGRVSNQVEVEAR